MCSAALSNLTQRLDGSEGAPPEHPLMEAARNSSEQKWSGCFFATDEDVTTPIEDLSE